MKKQVTKKQCKNLALNFTSRGCFKTNHYTHYMFARNNGFLDEICSHMIQNYRPKWSISKIIKIAKNCKTYNEFMLKENLAFNAAMRYKLIPKIKKILNHPNYTFEEHKEICRKEALKYTYRVDFQKGSPQLYNFAHRHNFLNEINKHMPIRNEKKWTKQSVIAIAKTCSDYKDFYDKYENTAYYAAYYRLKILPEIIKLLGEPNARPNYYFKGESKSRIILEGLLGIELKKTRNISDLQTKTGQNLELDGYNKKSKIAFEYNGEHHYNKNDFVYKKRKSKNTWEIQQENDQIKQKYCKKNKITLIIIPQHKNLKFNSLYTYIISILDTMNIKYKKNIDTETLKLTVNKVDEYRS